VLGPLLTVLRRAFASRLYFTWPKLRVITPRVVNRRFVAVVLGTLVEDLSLLLSMTKGWSDICGWVISIHSCLRLGWARLPWVAGSSDGRFDPSPFMITRPAFDGTLFIRSACGFFWGLLEEHLLWWHARCRQRVAGYFLPPRYLRLFAARRSLSSFPYGKAPPSFPICPVSCLRSRDKMTNRFKGFSTTPVPSQACFRSWDSSVSRFLLF